MLVSSGDTPDPLHMRSKQVEGWSYLRLVDEDESKFMGEGAKVKGNLVISTKLFTASTRSCTHTSIQFSVAVKLSVFHMEFLGIRSPLSLSPH